MLGDLDAEDNAVVISSQSISSRTRTVETTTVGVLSHHVMFPYHVLTQGTVDNNSPAQIVTAGPSCPHPVLIQEGLAISTITQNATAGPSFPFAVTYASTSQFENSNDPFKMAIAPPRSCSGIQESTDPNQESYINNNSSDTWDCLSTHPSHSLTQSRCAIRPNANFLPFQEFFPSDPKTVCDPHGTAPDFFLEDLICSSSSQECLDILPFRTLHQDLVLSSQGLCTLSSEACVTTTLHNHEPLSHVPPISSLMGLSSSNSTSFIDSVNMTATSHTPGKSAENDVHENCKTLEYFTSHSSNIRNINKTHNLPDEPLIYNVSSLKSSKHTPDVGNILPIVSPPSSSAVYFEFLPSFNTTLVVPNVMHSEFSSSLSTTASFSLTYVSSCPVSASVPSFPDIPTSQPSILSSLIPTCLPSDIPALPSESENPAGGHPSLHAKNTVSPSVLFQSLSPCFESPPCASLSNLSQKPNSTLDILSSIVDAPKNVSTFNPGQAMSITFEKSPVPSQSILQLNSPLSVLPSLASTNHTYSVCLFPSAVTCASSFETATSPSLSNIAPSMSGLKTFGSNLPYRSLTDPASLPCTSHCNILCSPAVLTVSDTMLQHSCLSLHTHPSSSQCIISPLCSSRCVNSSPMPSFNDATFLCTCNCDQTSVSTKISPTNADFTSHSQTTFSTVTSSSLAKLDNFCSINNTLPVSTVLTDSNPLYHPAKPSLKRRVYNSYKTAVKSKECVTSQNFENRSTDGSESLDTIITAVGDADDSRPVFLAENGDSAKEDLSRNLFPLSIILTSFMSFAVYIIALVYSIVYINFPASELCITFLMILCLVYLLL